MKNEIIKQLLDEILVSAIADDKKMQELAKAIAIDKEKHQPKK